MSEILKQIDKLMALADACAEGRWETKYYRCPETEDGDADTMEELRLVHEGKLVADYMRLDDGMMEERLAEAMFTLNAYRPMLQAAKKLYGEAMSHTTAGTERASILYALRILLAPYKGLKGLDSQGR